MRRLNLRSGEEFRTSLANALLQSFGYPASAMALIDENAKVKRGVLSALRKFKREKTFKKSDEERLTAMKTLIKELSEIYGIDPVKVKTENIVAGGFGDSGASSYSPSSNTITMRGRLSIITLLHEFRHAVKGRSEEKAVKWSVNLFRRVYPKQFARLKENGHTLRRND